MSVKRRIPILICTILASGMAFLDGTVVTVALPTLQRTLGATVSQIQWILDSYALALAALLLTAGTLSDNFGRKRVFLFGICVFTVGSFLCGLSATAVQLIWARAFQGVGAAFMIPGSLAIIYDAYPENERGKAIGLWAGFSGGLAALGPLLGGWLTQVFSWRAIFYINLPIGALAIVLTAMYVGHNRPDKRNPIDWLGTILITAALLELSFGAIEAPNFGLAHPLIWGSLALGGTCFVLFIWRELSARYPMLPLSLFKIREVAVANIATFFTYFALSSLIFLVVLNLQQLQRLTPIQAGLGLMPPILLTTFFSWVGGKITDAIGPRIPLSIGNLLIIGGILWAAFAGPGSGYWPAIFPGLMLFGFGMTFVIAPVTKASLTVDHARVGVASSVNNAVSRMAGLFAFAVAGTALAYVFKVQFLHGIELMSFTEAAREGLVSQVNKLAAIDVPADLPNGDGVVALIDNSFSSGYFSGMIANSVTVFISFLIVFFGLRPKRKRA